MSFWGPARLEERLRDGGRISTFCPSRIDGASYRLSIGHEVYVSPSMGSTDASTKSITRLKDREAFAIPPGQFAFLLTNETLRLDVEEIAFISIRATTKYRGLVNVSGFHVDPGFQGRLTFAVFNAGPVPVHLRQGDDIFLIWYADLSDGVTVPKEGQYDQIQSRWINGISGELHSLASLSASVTDVEQRLDQRLNAVTRELAIFRVVAAIAVTALVAVGGFLLRQMGS